MGRSNMFKSAMMIFLFAFISILSLTVSQNDCQPATCGPSSPVIRFPFWLKGHQPEHCGNPGFGLTCNGSGKTELDLQFPVKASNNILLHLNMTVAVWNIDYKAQKMLARYVRSQSCLPEKPPTVSSSASSPFEAEAIGYGDGSVLFNCSNIRDYETVTCLNRNHYKVINYATMYDITSLPPYSSCFKMYNISFIPDGVLTGGDSEIGTPFYLTWRRPSCGKCEQEGKHCRLQNTTAQETECFGIPHVTGASKSHAPLIAGIIAGVILLMLITMASLFVFRVMKIKKDEQQRIEDALKRHKGMKPRRYSYADVKRLTDNFSEKIGQGALRKGMLKDGTAVAVKVLEDSSEQDVEDFISEVEVIGRMQHANILQLIGFCIDRHKRALIYEFLQDSTLDMLISSENQSHTLGWEMLEKIALNIAKGIEYIRQDSTPRILNLVVSRKRIFLDHNFNPKILVATTSTVEVEIEYIAPELFTCSSNIIPQKAYAYGFGMLLLDMVGRRVDLRRESSGLHFPEWIFSRLENREERAIQIEEEGEANESVKKFSIIGLWCIQWFPSDRPSMKAVIGMLEQENMPDMPPNPFDLNIKR